MNFFNQYKKDFLKAIESQYYSEILKLKKERPLITSGFGFGIERLILF